MSMYNTMHLCTSRYTSIHHHTPLYITTHPCQHPRIIPCTSIHHHIPLFITIYLFSSPYTSIYHHTPMYKTMNPYTSPYTSIQHLTPLFITIHLYTMVMCRGLWLCIGFKVMYIEVYGDV